MGRLTKRYEPDGDSTCNTNLKCVPNCDNCEHMQKMMNKLADYEDLDERGMVIRDGDHCKLFANITIDKEDLQEMIDKKCSELFVEISINIDGLIDKFIQNCRESMDRMTACVPIEFIEDIGKELKEEWRQNEETDEN